MSREFFLVYDLATGEELSRGSGPEGAAELQQQDGRGVALITKDMARAARTYRVELATGEVVETQS